MYQRVKLLRMQVTELNCTPSGCRIASCENGFLFCENYFPTEKNEIPILPFRKQFAKTQKNVFLTRPEMIKNELQLVYLKFSSAKAKKQCAGRKPQVVKLKK